MVCKSPHLRHSRTLYNEGQFVFPARISFVSRISHALWTYPERARLPGSFATPETPGNYSASSDPTYVGTNRVVDYSWNPWYCFIRSLTPLYKKMQLNHQRWHCSKDAIARALRNTPYTKYPNSISDSNKILVHQNLWSWETFVSPLKIMPVDQTCLNLSTCMQVNGQDIPLTLTFFQ